MMICLLAVELHLQWPFDLIVMCLVVVWGACCEFYVNILLNCVCCEVVYYGVFEESLFFIYSSSPIFLLISKKLVSRLNYDREQTGKTIISSQPRRNWVGCNKKYIYSTYKHFLSESRGWNFQNFENQFGKYLQKM